MDTKVDILVANWNTLPWLRLLVSQARRFIPSICHTIHVWDGGSTDGSFDWLTKHSISFHSSKERISHASSLSQLIALTKAPYIALLDVDALPIEKGWLDDAIKALDADKAGAVGLKAGSDNGFHRVFIHPSFCVFKRALYEGLKLSLEIVHDYVKKAAFDVGEVLCARLQDEGYILKFLGSVAFDPDGKMGNKVVHFGMSTIGLSAGSTDPSWIPLINEVVKGHQRLLGHFGIWEQFKGYLRETSDLNPCCHRYLA